MSLDRASCSSPSIQETISTAIKSTYKNGYSHATSVFNDSGTYKEMRWIYGMSIRSEYFNSISEIEPIYPQQGYQKMLAWSNNWRVAGSTLFNLIILFKTRMFGTEFSQVWVKPRTSQNLGRGTERKGKNGTQNIFQKRFQMKCY